MWISDYCAFFIENDAIYNSNSFLIEGIQRNYIIQDDECLGIILV